ncbi:MAG: hypothetical protein J2P25_20445 [Nocardiopsaceae bacterium]|nr:hypothetical protein [Nocardiopsaceae bacterium]
MERDLAQRPGAARALVQLPVAERPQAGVPDERQPPQPAPGLVQVVVGEGGEIGGGRDRGGMPAVRFRGPAGQPGLQLGQVIDEVVGHPPDRLVRRIDPWRLAFDGYLDGPAVPPGPGRGQVQHVVHHAGHDIGRVPLVRLRSRIGHE